MSGTLFGRSDGSLVISSVDHSIGGVGDDNIEHEGRSLAHRLVALVVVKHTDRIHISQSICEESSLGVTSDSPAESVELRHVIGI